MKREYYITPKPSGFMKFFWTAAGADSYILERATYSDQIKYMCLGGIVVATGVMAAIAGGYAFYTIFEPRGSAIEQTFHWGTSIAAMLFGAIWGLMIFNIDRFIVTSTGKGDGTEAITLEELKGALPRIVMGAIIALTISKPVEIRMFKTEIDIKLHEEQIKQEQRYKAEVDSVFNSEIKKKQEVIASKLSRIATLQEISDKRKADIAYETGNGECKTKCEEYKRQLAANETEIAALKADPEFIKVKKELDGIEQQRNTQLDKSKKVAAGLDGLLERIKLAHEIAGFWISLFITLLFMTIELTPIFFKLMLVKTPYDYMEENIKELMKAEEGVYIQYNYYKDKQGLERDLVTHMNVEKLIHEKLELLKVQKELTQHAVEKYKEKVKAQIDANPDAYIRVTNEDLNESKLN